MTRTRTLRAGAGTRVLWLLAASCGGGGAGGGGGDGGLDAALSPDAPIDAAADAPTFDRVSGNVDFNGGLAGVQVVTLTDGSQTTTTDGNGDFQFDAPDGSHLVMEALADNPMIRGVVVAHGLRIREFYVLGGPDFDAAASLGKSFDPTKGIVEVDFRNSAIGGYGVIMTSGSGSAVVTPEYGMVYDDNGSAVLSETTVTGGDGSTLLLANVPPGDVSFTPIVPGSAAYPCHTDGDAQPLPVAAGTTTWFDFECGSATD